MPRVLLIYPKIESAFDVLRKKRPMPLGLLSAAVHLGDYDVKIFDQNLHGDWKAALGRELTPDTVIAGVSAMTGTHLLHALEISNYIKSISRVPIVWGGVFPSLQPETVLEEGPIDYACIGEGEETLPELVRAIGSGSSTAGIRGLCRRENGNFIYGGDRPFADLDNLPDLPYSLLDIGEYNMSEGFRFSKGDLKLQMETSRGCSRSCIFCYNPVYSRRTWRFQSAGRVLERIGRLVKDYGATHIDFIDDAFFTDPARVEKIAKGMISDGMRILWFVNGADVDRVAGFDDAYLRLLEDSGCRALRLGAESGSAKILESINKQSGIEDLLAVNRRLKKYAITPWYYFTIGMIGETIDDLRATVDMIFRLMEENPAARVVATLCLTPIAGTRLLVEAEKAGYKSPRSIREWARIDGTKIVTPWFDEKMKRDLNFLFLTSLFVDRKSGDVIDSALLRLISGLYRPVARFRMRRMFFRLPLEYRIFRWLVDRRER